LESVRNRIFEWSLELEARGVLGEGLTFSNEERERATNVTHNYTTNIGSIAGPSQFQQGTTSSTQSLKAGIDSQALTALVDSLMSQLDEMRAEGRDDRRARDIASSGSFIETKDGNH